MMMKCQKCGFENQLGVIFCRSCGAKLDTTALSPENLDTGLAKTKKKKSGWLGFVLYIVGIVVIAGLIYAFYATPSGTEYKESTADYKSKTQKLESSSSVSLTAEEISAYFNQEVLRKDDPKCPRISFQIKGHDMTVLVNSKIAGFNTVTAITGKLSKGTDDDPVKFAVSGISTGYIPLTPAKDVILGRFAPLMQKSDIQDVFRNAEKVEVKDGAVYFTFAPKKRSFKVTPQKESADPVVRSVSDMKPGTTKATTDGTKKKKSKKRKN